MPDNPKPRGGRRPGAGAPKGNLNALKSGQYSMRLKALELALTAMPRTTDTLVQLTGRDRKKDAVRPKVGKPPEAARPWMIDWRSASSTTPRSCSSSPAASPSPSRVNQPVSTNRSFSAAPSTR